MKTYSISILSLLLALLFLAGCSDRKKFFEDERYEKMVYIVSDNNNIHNLVYDLDGKDGNIRNLSIACSGTNPTEEPATISLTEDTILLDQYNYTNFIEDYSRYALKMDPKDYAIESSTVTYPTGEPYTLVPIKIDISVIESLDPDKIYFIPIAIADATPYPIVKKKGNALLQIQKKNKYTSSAEPASYNASGYEGSGYFGITKTMVPLTKNRVRINIGTKRLPAEPENQPAGCWKSSRSNTACRDFSEIAGTAGTQYQSGHRKPLYTMDRAGSGTGKTQAAHSGGVELRRL